MQQGDCDDERQSDLHRRERPHAEDIQRGDAEHDDRHPELRITGDLEELRQDDRRKQRLGRRREDHDCDVAHQCGQ